MKKRLLGVMLLMFSISMIPLGTMYALDEDPYYDFLQEGTPDADEPGDIIRQEQGVLNELLELFGLGDFLDGGNTVFGYITFIINILLGLAAFIALLWLIYGFYRLFFVKYDDGINKARDIIKGAVIALAVIGLSWVITRFLFRVVSLFIG